ncbi:MAG: autotransporter-associated beta strand repeat-containing protein [Kiritimatiellae bacterium]|nr:autotransporter-associated beta strand repeat-containing protein [Kiritimatiellia bacterium]
MTSVSHWKPFAGKRACNGTWRLAACLVASAFIVLSAGASNYYLKPAATDWSNPESFALDSADGADATVCPGSSDIVYLPANKTCSFTGGTESFNVFANVHTVVPDVDGGDEIEITVSSGTNELNCAITGYGYDKRKIDSYYQCLVTKKGAGALALKSVDKHGAEGISSDYLCCFMVETGDLIMPQNPVTTTVYAGALTVAAGARFFLAPTVDTSFHNGLGLVGGLHGAGLVTNDNAAAAVLYPIGYAKAGAIEDVPFSGRIDGAVHLMAASADLVGTNSTFTGSAYATYGQVNNVPEERYGMRVRKFGKTGQPSSIGSGDIVGAGLYGGYILYTGDDDEDCDKKFYFDSIYNNNVPPSTLDAGHHGGLRFTGTWTGKSTYSQAKYYQNRLVLTGSNTVPCVIDAPINSWRYTSGCPQLPFHVMKRGTGIWELSGNAKNSTNPGATTVEEGTLRYDSLAEVGEKCSLGMATNLHEFATGNVSEIPEIPFAIVLGGSNTTGRLEYVGNEKFSNNTRHIGLAGAGVLASTQTNVAFNGVASYGEGARTLILDGSRSGGIDSMRNITNGQGVVSVVKTGSGTWTLGGELSFSGELVVSNGVLDVIASDALFSWFRMTIKDCGATDAVPRLYELALYDANGKRQNIGLKCNRLVEPGPNTTIRAWSTMLDAPENLEAGWFMFGQKDTRSYWQTTWTSGSFNMDRDVTAIFSDTGSYDADKLKKYCPGKYPQYEEYCPYTQGWCWAPRDGSAQIPRLDNESTWLPITMHLTNGTPEIVAYDMVGYASSPGTNMITRWSFDGSVDGRTWETLTNVDFTAEYMQVPSTGWYSTKKTTAIPGRSLAAGEGFPLRGRGTPSAVSPLSNVSGVYVAPGATLKAYGTVVLPAITLDPAGMGTLDGFSFAESGMLNAVGVPDGSQPIELPFEFANATGVDNIANWSVRINGRSRRGWKIERRGDKFLLVPPGAVIIVK